MRSIVVIMAMEAEARPFVDRISATPFSLSTSLPYQGFETQINRCRVSVVVNGQHPRLMVDHIGTDAAAVNMMLAIDRCRPDLVITAGSSGGRRGSGHDIGDVVIVEGQFVHHDRRIPLPGFAELGVGRFPAARVDTMARSLDLPCGAFSTGNSFGETPEDLSMIGSSGTVAIDMESAAVASVCELVGVSATGVRVIANFIDDGHASIGEFQRELPDAAERLANALVEVVHYCAARDVGELSDTER